MSDFCNRTYTLCAICNLSSGPIDQPPLPGKTSCIGLIAGIGKICLELANQGLGRNFGVFLWKPQPPHLTLSGEMWIFFHYFLYKNDHLM